MTDRPAILITGATDGLGRALAQALAADGATLILHGRDQRRLDRTADDIGDAGAASGLGCAVLAGLHRLDSPCRAGSRQVGRGKMEP